MSSEGDLKSFRDSIKLVENEVNNLRQDRRTKVTEYILYRASGTASSSDRTGGQSKERSNSAHAVKHK